MTAELDVDVAIIGAGFGGSVTALLLDRIGLRSVLVDRGSHPRFVIGESSTPSADLILRELARRYDLPRLGALSSYGTWKAAFPEVVRGLKRGFSYFRHLPEAQFTPQARHTNELLVAASAEDYHADTHWLRSDVDAFLANEAVAAGVPYFDRMQLAVEEAGPVWRLVGEREGEAVKITARMVVDASGEGSFLPRALGLASRAETMHTHSRGLYAHFDGLAPWREVLAQQGARLDDHPFPCDCAALHHVLDEGWMWQLRFDNGITSAGFAINTLRSPLDESISPEAEWQRLMDRYPSIATQFSAARLTQSAGGLRRTGRMQRHVDRIAGENWLLLPHTAGFIDPLNSTGIAHTLCGIERLVQILERHWNRGSLAEELGRYAEIVHAELDLIDELIGGCYQAMADFKVFIDFSMLYFAVATTYEHRRFEGRVRPGDAFLCAEDVELRATVRAVRKRLEETLAASDRAGASRRFADFVSQAIQPFNIAGLCDPSVCNMYRYTAAKKG